MFFPQLFFPKPHSLVLHHYHESVPLTTLHNPSWVVFFSVPQGPHLKFTDEVEALQVQVDKLQTLGFNKIIALGHSGFEVDQDIAKRVRGVDVVIGGHTNTFLYTGTLLPIVFNGSRA